jgi:hypothetical protein
VAKTRENGAGAPETSRSRSTRSGRARSFLRQLFDKVLPPAVIFEQFVKRALPSLGSRDTAAKRFHDNRQSSKRLRAKHAIEA